MNKIFYTVAEFAKMMDLTEEYVRQGCREQPIGRSGAIAKLPDGWKAHKEGLRSHWRIYKEDCPVKDNSDTSPSVPLEVNLGKLYLTELLKTLQPGWTAPESLIDDCYRRILKSIPKEHLSEQVIEVWWTNARFRAAFGKAMLSKGLPELPRFETGQQLLDQLGEAYILAVNSKESVKLTVQIKPDGNHILKVVEPDNDPLSTLIESPTAYTFEELFISSWINEANLKLKKEIIGRSIIPTGSSMYHAELRRRCLNCGEVRPKTKSTHYCSSECNKQHSEWMSSLCKHTTRPILANMRKRFKDKVRPNLPDELI